MQFKATEFVKESRERIDRGWRRKVVFNKGQYRGVTVYTREQVRYHDNVNQNWRADKIEYSLDMVKWHSEWMDIYRAIKKMGL